MHIYVQYQIRKLSERACSPSEQISDFTGDLAKKSNGYEDDFARLIGAIPRKDRYSDCVWNGLNIEVKKSKSHAWLDLVRYCEYVVGVTKESVITLFLFYKNSEITSIYAVTPEKLLEALWLDEEHHTGRARQHIHFSQGSSFVSMNTNLKL